MLASWSDAVRADDGSEVSKPRRPREKLIHLTTYNADINTRVALELAMLRRVLKEKGEAYLVSKSLDLSTRLRFCFSQTSPSALPWAQLLLPQPSKTLSRDGPPPWPTQNREMKLKQCKTMLEYALVVLKVITSSLELSEGGTWTTV